MTPHRNKLNVSQLMLAFQLFMTINTVILPLTSARNIKLSTKTAQSELLVIMASGVNVTTIYKSFNDFKKMFSVEFPDDRRIAFKTAEGELNHNLRLDFPLPCRRWFICHWDNFMEATRAVYFSKPPRISQEKQSEEEVSHFCSERSE